MKTGTMVRAAAVLLWAAVLTMLVCADASAQRFEWLYGGGCKDSAHGGVQQVSEGGYVAAGVTTSVNIGCTATDVYVVRTNNDGTLAWSRTYSFGLDNIAYDIEEVKTPAGAFDGFVVVGTTRDPAPCANVNHDLLLIRLDRCGNVRWALSVDNGDGGYEVGYDVVVAANGDFIAAGTTTFGQDGFLIRVSPTGALLWAKLYNGTRNGIDYFYAVDEAANGDIIVAGGSNSTPSGTFDAWILRTSSTGTFGAAPQGAVTYGGTASNDELRSIQEITQGSQAGDIVGVGKSDYAHNGNPEVLLVETGPDPCTNHVVQLYGDNGNDPDEGYCVREITPFTGAGASSIIVTGYLTPPLSVSFGLTDVFLKKFVTGTLAQAPGVTGAIYGSARNDAGWSVSQVVAGASCFTDGFVAAGWGHGSMADPCQLYLIKTDAALSDSCNDYFYSATSTTPTFSSECRLPDVADTGAWCVPDVSITCPTWATRLCYTSDGVTACSIPDCEPCGGAKRTHPDPTDEDGIVNIGGAILPYPSPVQRGSTMTIEYVAPSDGAAEILVSDMTGTVVHQRRSDCTAGVNRAALNTAGWPGGAYMIRVRVGNRSLSRGVTVIGK